MAKSVSSLPFSLTNLCLFLKVHWDDPEGWYGEGGGRRVQFLSSFDVYNTVLLTIITVVSIRSPELTY